MPVWTLFLMQRFSLLLASQIETDCILLSPLRYSTVAEESTLAWFNCHNQCLVEADSSDLASFHPKSSSLSI